MPRKWYFQSTSQIRFRSGVRQIVPFQHRWRILISVPFRKTHDFHFLVLPKRTTDNTSTYEEAMEIQSVSRGSSSLRLPPVLRTVRLADVNVASKKWGAVAFGMVSEPGKVEVLRRNRAQTNRTNRTVTRMLLTRQATGMRSVKRPHASDRPHE